MRAVISIFRREVNAPAGPARIAMGASRLRRPALGPALSEIPHFRITLQPIRAARIGHGFPVPEEIFVAAISQRMSRPFRGNGSAAS